MAKILVTFVVYILFSSHSIAQTIGETEDWIIKQTEKNDYRLKHSIEGDELISSMSMPSLKIGEGMIQKAIPISQVTTISYTHTNEYLSYRMSCEAPCAYLLDEPDNKRSHFLFEIYANLDASYVPRMNKALLNLVRLHGGSAKIVKAQVVQEAY